MELPRTTATCTVALENKRDARLTMPWFVEKGKAQYPPRAYNLIKPLINGERTFQAVHDALAGATRTIDIISWGFDPSMHLKRTEVEPLGERLGDLLRRKANGSDGQPPVQVRILIWKNALANVLENNIIGDGLSSSGGTALGSGIRSGSANDGSAAGATSDTQGVDTEFNDYGGKLGGSAEVEGDPAADEYNRAWFSDLPDNLAFLTRDFSLGDRKDIFDKLHDDGLVRTPALSLAPSHHQKTILVDYELPVQATGFVMGHNLLRNYWDTDSHKYYSDLRHGFAPWQDLSCQVSGPVLYDLNQNFVTAWDKADGWFSKLNWNPERQARRANDFIAPILKHGTEAVAQICRTQPQEDERSILEAYRLALTNARRYLYFENQYFRYKELAEMIRDARRCLKGGGWPGDFYLFVVTNVPDDKGRTYTYEMLAALGQGHRMPAYHQEATAEPDPDAALRQIDLEGLNIHIATLMASGGPVDKSRYQPIYVHSKLLLADDTFFTLGSANINLRSMEVDSELNISCPSPELTWQWREHLWRIHTGEAPKRLSGDLVEDMDNMQDEFDRWGGLMKENTRAMDNGEPLTAPLMDFYDDADTTLLAPD